jgi:outer membrane protein assembly factor BamB
MPFTSYCELTSMKRRTFLSQAALATAAAAAPSLALAKKPNYDLPRRVGGAVDRPRESHGGPLGLPPWAYGKDSASADTVLMFRGNPSHTFYGTGAVPEKPRILWRHRMIDFNTLYYGKPHSWRGTGWTGQAAKLGNFIFVGSQGGHLYCFEADTGKVRWRFKGHRMFKASVCLYNNRIYVGNVDNYLRCLDANTGHVLWKLRWSRDLDSSACVQNGKLYIAGESGYARCLNPDTGALIWKTFVDGINRGPKGGSYGAETSPAVADGEYYCATYDGILFSLDAATGKERWRAKTGDDTDSSPVIYKDRVYAAAENKYPYVQCFSRKDGKKLWEAKGPGGFWGTPAVVDDTVYIGSHGGQFVALDAGSGKEKWRYRIGSPTWSSPTVVGDHVVFGAFDGRLRSLDKKTGKEIFSLKLGGRIHSTPCIVDGKIYIGTRSGFFYALGS